MTSTVPASPTPSVADEVVRLRHERDRLRALAARALEEQERAARRVSRQLDTEVADVTAGAQVAIEATVRHATPGPLRERLLWVLELLDALEHRLRRIAHEIRPPLLDDRGFGPALGFLVEDFASRAHVPVDIEGELPGMDPELETVLFRVVQQALDNVALHARARRVWIRLECRRRRVRCSVRDDGRGFDPHAPGRPPGLGLIAMRERLLALGGRLEVIAAPRAGTEVIATAPLDSARGPRRVLRA